MSELLKERVLLVLALMLCVVVSLFGAWDAPEVSPVRVVYTQAQETVLSSVFPATSPSSMVTEQTGAATSSALDTTTQKTSTTRFPTSASPVVTGKVNINTASKEQLSESLNGIGETLAQRIIDYREAHGGFDSVEEIMMVTGIGEKRYAAIKDHITID